VTEISPPSPLKALAIPKSAAAAKKDLKKYIRWFGDCRDFGLLEVLRTNDVDYHPSYSIFSPRVSESYVFTITVFLNRMGPINLTASWIPAGSSGLL
jgi:hypothetical protein